MKVINIKVLHIVSGNDNGGGAIHVLNICKCNNNQIESSICSIGKGYLYEEALKLDINTNLFGIKDTINGKLVDFINDRDAEIVNFHGAKANFVYSIIYKKINKPCTVTVHSDYRFDFQNNKFKQLLFTPLSKNGLIKFDNYICVSNYIKDIIQENNIQGEKFIVGNGINISENRKQIDDNEIKRLRNSLSLREEDFVYIMVARMHPIKNHEGLINAFNKLYMEFKDVKLVLVGGGKLEDELKEKTLELKINEVVIFTGHRNDIFELISASDISVLTSFSEGGAPPLVILESAIVGKPVICSNVGDMPYIIDNNNGYLIEPTSVDDIYLKMKLAYLNKNKIKMMGENLYATVESQYSIESFWNRYFEAYTNIISSYKKKCSDM